MCANTQKKFKQAFKYIGIKCIYIYKDKIICI